MRRILVEIAVRVLQLRFRPAKATTPEAQEAAWVAFERGDGE